MKTILSSQQIQEDFDFDPFTSSVTQLTTDQLSALASAIIDSVVYELQGANTFFVSLLNTTATVDLYQPSGGDGSVGGSQLSIDDWGDGVAKVIAQTFSEFFGNGISVPNANALSSTTASSRRSVRQSTEGLSPEAAPTRATGAKNFFFFFLFKIDRMAADGTLKNDVRFCFKFDSNATTVGVLVQHNGDNAWHNINSQCAGEGLNRWCGNCTHNLGHFSCCNPHTSTFTAYAVPETVATAGPSSGINMVMIIAPAAAVSGFAVVLLIAVYCICVSRRGASLTSLSGQPWEQWSQEYGDVLHNTTPSASDYGSPYHA